MLEEAYDKIHGQGSFDALVLTKIGSRLATKFVSAGNLDGIKYLIEEKKFSCERLALYWYMDNYNSCIGNAEILKFLLDSGMKTVDAICLFCDESKIIVPIFDFLIASKDDALVVFFEALIAIDGKHFDESVLLQKILQMDGLFDLLKRNKSLASKLYKYFFLFCSSAENFEIILSIGLDPRELIDSKILCFGRAPWLEISFWENLRDRFQMKYEDFEKIKFRASSPNDRAHLHPNDCSISFIESLSDNYHGFNNIKIAFEGKVLTNK